MASTAQPRAAAALIERRVDTVTMGGYCAIAGTAILWPGEVSDDMAGISMIMTRYDMMT